MEKSNTDGFDLTEGGFEGSGQNHVPADPKKLAEAEEAKPDFDLT